MTTGPVFQVVPRAGLANRMPRYLVALNFRAWRRAPASPTSHCRNGVSVIRLRHLWVPSKRWPKIVCAVLTISRRRLVTANSAASRTQPAACGYPNLPDPAACRDVFRTDSTAASRYDARSRYDERYVICPLSVGDPLGGQGLNFPLTPVEFFADIVAATGLIPVFIGQTRPDPYTNRLRARFPMRFSKKPESALQDFATIRQARNIVPCVTVLAWLAAWLSDAGRIFLPVSGVFNPMQFRHAKLLPFGDPRYRFYLFPLNYGVPIGPSCGGASAHRALLAAGLA